MPRILHFSDANIGAANYGRRDPQTGLPLRVMDYLKSLDTIIETAITEKVDLVLFTGNAYHHHSPSLTLQREWERRVMRLSKARIPTLMLVGSHDLAPGLNRAHALETFNTLDVPYVRVLDRPVLLGPGGFKAVSSKQEFSPVDNIKLQIIALPWFMPFSHAAPAWMAQLGLDAPQRIPELVRSWLSSADPTLPTILAAHALVQEHAPPSAPSGQALGAGEISHPAETELPPFAEHDITNGLALPLSLLQNPHLDYVALGSSANPQDLNPDGQPPVIYPGSIERADFREAGQDRYFVLVEVERGHTQVEWRKLGGIRPFINCSQTLQPETGTPSTESVTTQLKEVLPPPDEFKDAIVRLVLEYPHQWEAWIDEAALQAYTAEAFAFHLVKRPYRQSPIQMPTDQSVSSLSAADLLDLYWKSNDIPEEERAELLRLAQAVIDVSQKPPD
jgi:exonuclease SbcD